jgi:galactose mutarotase-like enzyme
MGQGHWISAEREGYPAWIGRTDEIELCVIPRLGSKIISLVNRRTNREWLWSSGKPLGNLGYATSYGAGDESGWDEMFPGINVSTYPEEPWQGARIPDHGEVWSLEWESRLTDEGLICAVEGVAFPYRLEKAISFADENTLRIDYVLTNLSHHPFSFAWAAHPLLRVHEGMKLLVPESMNEIEVAYSGGKRLGTFQDIRGYPLARRDETGDSVDLSLLEPSNPRIAEKYYFTGTMTEGWAALSDPATGEAITFRFPEDQVPYLGIWANAGAYTGYYHFAIEPATGRMDDLGHAMREREAATVEGNGTYSWHLEVALS